MLVQHRRQWRRSAVWQARTARRRERGVAEQSGDTSNHRFDMRLHIAAKRDRPSTMRTCRLMMGTPCGTSASRQTSLSITRFGRARRAMAIEINGNDHYSLACSTRARRRPPSRLCGHISDGDRDQRQRPLRHRASRGNDHDRPSGGIRFFGCYIDGGRAVFGRPPTSEPVHRNGGGCQRHFARHGGSRLVRRAPESSARLLPRLQHARHVRPVVDRDRVDLLPRDVRSDPRARRRSTIDGGVMRRRSTPCTIRTRRRSPSSSTAVLGRRHRRVHSDEVGSAWAVRGAAPPVTSGAASASSTTRCFSDAGSSRGSIRSQPLGHARKRSLCRCRRAAAECREWLVVEPDRSAE